MNLKNSVVQTVLGVLVICAIFGSIVLAAQAFDAYNTRTFGAVESPDGTKLAVVKATTRSGYDIFIVSKATGESTQLTHDGLAFSPAWFADGTRIAWHCSSKKAGIANICVTSLLDGTTTRLTNDDAFDSSPTVSPGGSDIAFTRQNGNKMSIQVLNLKSGYVSPLLGRSDAKSPQWHPTEQWTILYASEVEMISHVMMYKNGGVTDLGVGGGGIWSPDGKRIIFRRVEPCDTRIAKCIIRVYLMNADGAGVQLFPALSSGATSWSSDGQSVYSSKSFWLPDVLDREWIVSTNVVTGQTNDVNIK